MPKAYIYARVSKLDEEKAKKEGRTLHSLADQETHLRKLFDETLAPQGFELGAILFDPGVSAWKHELFSRPDGMKLQMRKLTPMGKLEPGDVVVIDRLDRGFRSSSDISLCIKYWEKHGVQVIIRQLQGMNLHDAVGKLIVTVLGAIAQFQSDLLSERMRERAAMARAQGRPTSGTPRGWRKSRTRDGIKVVPDWRARQIMALMLELNENKGMSPEKIAWELTARWSRLQGVSEEEIASLKNRQWHWEWSRQRVQDWMRTARQLRSEGNLYPSNGVFRRIYL